MERVCLDKCAYPHTYTYVGARTPMCKWVPMDVHMEIRSWCQMLPSGYCSHQIFLRRGLLLSEDLSN